MVGIISDTHGLLRPEAAALLNGADLILHAGDLGSEEVLSQLRQIAPVIAVRGNVDTGPWAKVLPLTAIVDLQGVSVFLIHNIDDLRRHPPPPNTGVIIYGHSHKPAHYDQDGVSFLNPGSAGPRRFSLPVSLVLAYRDGDRWEFAFRDLNPQKLRRPR